MATADASLAEAEQLTHCVAAEGGGAQRRLGMRRPTSDELRRAHALLHGGPRALIDGGEAEHELVDQALDERDDDNAFDDHANWHSRTLDVNYDGHYDDAGTEHFNDHAKYDDHGHYEDGPAAQEEEHLDEVDEDSTWFAAAPPQPEVPTEEETIARYFRYRDCPLPGVPAEAGGSDVLQPAVVYSAGAMERQLRRRMLAAPADFDLVPLCLYPLILEHLPLVSWARLALCSAPWADAVAEALEHPDTWSEPEDPGFFKSLNPNQIYDRTVGPGQVIRAMIARRRAPEIERSYGSPDNLVARLKAIASAANGKDLSDLNFMPDMVAGFMKRVGGEWKEHHVCELLRQFVDLRQCYDMEETGWAGVDMQELLKEVDPSIRNSAIGLFALEVAADCLPRKLTHDKRHAFFFLNCFGSMMDDFDFDADAAQSAALAAAELYVNGPKLVAILDVLRNDEDAWTRDDEDGPSFDWNITFLRTWSQAVDFPAAADPASRASVFEFIAASDAEWKRALGPVLWAWVASLGRAVATDPTAGEALAALGDAMVAQ